jgi:hypothetical protein
VSQALIVMPVEVDYHNACNERCDVIAGPCACGAWHSVGEWDRRTIDGKAVSGHWSFRRAVEGEAKP